MSTFLWILQWILGIGILFSGLMKFQPFGRLAADERMGWVNDVGARVVRTAGVTEVLAALGLILPGLFGIAEWLIVVAAFGLVAQVLIAAFWVHRPRGETPFMAMNFIIALIALVIAIGRIAEPLG